ncbi:MAG: DsbA family protein [Aggregatilineales bacterium]
MKRIIGVVLLFVAALALPASAQDTTAPADLPPGCNTAALSGILVSASEFVQNADRDTVISVIMQIETMLAETKVACAENGMADDDMPDFSAVPQSRTDDGGFVLGSPDAPVTIVEFSDYLCGHCQAYESVVRQFIAEYVLTGKARFEYRFFPVIDQQWSPLLARMTECSELLVPGSFWKAHTIMFDLAAEGLSGVTPFIFATRAGLDYNEMVTCVRTANQVATDAQVGQAAGITGTPAVRVRFGDGEIEVITLNGQAYDRGGASLDVLAQVVGAAE